MQQDLLGYTQELDGYQVVGWKVLANRCIVLEDLTALQRLSVRRTARATLNVWIECGCEAVSVSAWRERTVRGLPVCSIPTVIHVTSHRTYCPDCGRRRQEKLPFLSHPKARVTKQLERTIMALRGEMSVSAILDYCDLDWNTVKNIEKRRLAEKYAHVPLNRVSAIGIDGFASIEYSARLLLEDWCETARATQVPELEAMARTITEHMEGVLGYWRFDGASNASTEGFNNKIRWLITQAYGLRDREYFKLNVFSLPTLKTSKSLKNFSTNAGRALVFPNTNTTSVNRAWCIELIGRSGISINHTRHRYFGN